MRLGPRHDNWGWHSAVLGVDDTEVMLIRHPLDELMELRLWGNTVTTSDRIHQDFSVGEVDGVDVGVDGDDQAADRRPGHTRICRRGWAGQERHDGKASFT